MRIWITTAIIVLGVLLFSAPQAVAQDVTKGARCSPDTFHRYSFTTPGAATSTGWPDFQATLYYNNLRGHVLDAPVRRRERCRRVIERVHPIRELAGWAVTDEAVRIVGRVRSCVGRLSGACGDRRRREHHGSRHYRHAQFRCSRAAHISRPGGRNAGTTRRTPRFKVSAMPETKQTVTKDDPRYQPTKAELDEDVSIRDATPEDLARAVVGKHPQRVTH